MSQNGLIGIFGGTFDPIHNGHINSVLSLCDEFDFAKLFLLPSSTPPHRPKTSSSAADRLKMVELAIRDYPRLGVDDRESRIIGKSYTIDTLVSYRAQYPHAALVFIAGMDAYLDIPNWRQWQDFLRYAHIMVMKRPGYRAPSNAWGNSHLARDKSEITNAAAGKIYYANSRQIDISATEIRDKLQAGENVETLLPAFVINHIETHQLYVHT